MSWIKAYKGFTKGMKCRDYQYAEGKTYELPEGLEAKLCKSGFHACEAPIDCLSYYAPADSVYHEVKLDATDEKSDDSKRVGRRIKIGTKLSIKGLVEAQIEFVKERAVNDGGGHSTGDGSANSATGYWSANVSTGNYCSNSGGAGTISVGWGMSNKCKGDIGAYLVLCERGNWDGDKYPLIGEPVLLKIDGKQYKSDTWYMLKDGKIVKAGDSE